MAEFANITSPQLQALILRFRALGVALKAPLEAGNVAITEEVKSALTTLYGERLAAHWDIESAAGEGEELARVRVSSDDPRVRGYEFGTRPHAIAAHQPPRALAFQMAGQQAFFTRINHPGTRPHDHREAVKLALAMSAREQWRLALTAALHSNA